MTFTDQLFIYSITIRNVNENMENSVSFGPVVHFQEVNLFNITREALNNLLL